MATLKDEYMAMTGANKYLLGHVEKTLDELKAGYRGASHSINRCVGDYTDCFAAIDELRARCDTLEAERTEADAAIGQLRESLGKAREAYARLAGTIETGGANEP